MEVTLGHRLREARKAKGLRKTRLAALAKIRPSNITRYERGDQVPTTETLEVLAPPLGLQMGDLLTLRKVAVQAQKRALAEAILERLRAETPGSPYYRPYQTAA